MKLRIYIPVIILLFQSMQAFALKNTGGGRWQFTEAFIIDSPAGELTDYQVFISSTVLNTGKLLQDGVLQPALEDIRFSSGGTELPYWIDDSDTPGCWVRVPGVKTTGTELLFHYGNSSATAVSNANDTFTFYDTFNDLSGWKTLGGSWEIIDGVLFGAPGENNILRTKNKYKHANVLVRLKPRTLPGSSFSFEWKKTTRRNYKLTCTTGTICISRDNIVLPGIPVNFFGDVTIETRDLNGIIKILAGDNASVYSDSEPYNSGYYFALGTDGAGFDELLVRNYAEPEPSVQSSRRPVALQPVNLLCEGAGNPQKVVDHTPEFSWNFLYAGGYAHEELPQYAYRLIVSTGLSAPAAWDSGIVISPEESSDYSGSGLKQGTTYYWKVRTWVNETSSSPYSGTGRFNYAFNTPPGRPVNLRCNNEPGVVKTALIKPLLSWDFFDLDHRSTQEAFKVLISSFPGTHALWDSGRVDSKIPAVFYGGPPLVPGTTYHWKVRTWDDGSSSGPYSDTGYFHFIYDPALYPEPVQNLVAKPVSGKKVYLSWTVPVSTGTAGYAILYSTNNFAAESERISALSNWTSPRLEEGIQYNFVVRAFNSAGYMENNENTVSATAFKKPPAILSAFKGYPGNGKKVCGNRLALMLEFQEESLARMETAYFEVKQKGGNDWKKIPVVKTGDIYSCFWDTSVLDEGAYTLRTNLKERTKAKPLHAGNKTIFIDRANPDIEEKYEDHLLQKTEKLKGNMDNTINLIDRNMKITKLFIPAGTLSEASGTIRILQSPATIAGIDNALIPLCNPLEISLQGAELLGTVQFSIPYADSDDNGIIDGSSPPVHESDALPYRLNSQSNNWEKIDSYELDTSENRIYLDTHRFSSYVLLGRSLDTLKNPFNYPNPAGAGGTYFIYQLAETGFVSIKVYTVANRLVKILLDDESRAAGHHEEFWDCTDDGSPPAELANGQYFYRISVHTASGELLQKTGKLVIMR